MNKYFKIIVVLLSSLFLSFAANSVEVKFGHVGKPGSLFSASVDEFAKLANKRLGNKGKVTVFGSSQLGKDKQGMQKLKLGTVNMWLPSSEWHQFMMSLVYLICLSLLKIEHT